MKIEDWSLKKIAIPEKDSKVYEYVKGTYRLNHRAMGWQDRSIDEFRMRDAKKWIEQEENVKLLDIRHSFRGPIYDEFEIFYRRLDSED